MSENVPVNDLRNAIRAKTVGSNKIFKTKLVEFNGVDIEIKEPSVKIWGQILKAVMTIEDGVNKTEMDKYLIWSVIYCSFVPESNTRVFEDTDYESLEGFPRSGFVGEFSEIALEMMNSDAEKTEKNSEETAIDSQ